MGDFETAQYAIAGLGRAGVMRAGWHIDTLLCLIGEYASDDDFYQMERDSVRICEAGADEIGTASFTIVAGSGDTRPAVGDPVVIAIGTIANPIFAGELTRVRYSPRSLTYTACECEAQSLAAILDRRLVSGVWSGMYTGEILTAVLAEYASDLSTIGDVDRGVYVEQYTANFQSLSEICADLADRSNYTFYVAPTQSVAFKLRDKATAPFELDAAERFADWEITPDLSQLRNRVLVRYSLLETRTESFVGDGTTTIFTLSRIPVASVTGISVDGTPITAFGQRWAEDNSTHDFSYDEATGEIHTVCHTVLTSSNTLTVTYQAATPARLERSDSSSQAAYGVFDYLIDDREITTLADAQQTAQAELDLYAQPRLSASYTRREQLFDLQANALQVGQQQRVNRDGYDEYLSIERIEITVEVPANDYRLVFNQRVELGSVEKGLDRLLHTVTNTSTDTVLASQEYLTEESV